MYSKTVQNKKLLVSVANSYSKFSGFQLPNLDSSEELFLEIENLPYPLLSHTNQADPIFNYGNKKGIGDF